MKPGPKGPRTVIDEAMLTKLAMMGCTMKEMAAVFECSVDTLERNFADLIQEGKEKGKSSVRRMIWKHAEQTGNSLALKYLVHNVLKEKLQDEEATTEIKITISDYVKK